MRMGEGVATVDRKSCKGNVISFSSPGKATRLYGKRDIKKRSCLVYDEICSRTIAHFPSIITSTSTGPTHQTADPSIVRR